MFFQGAFKDFNWNVSNKWVTELSVDYITENENFIDEEKSNILYCRTSHFQDHLSVDRGDRILWKIVCEQRSVEKCERS